MIPNNERDVLGLVTKPIFPSFGYVTDILILREFLFFENTKPTIFGSKRDLVAMRYSFVYSERN